MAALGLLAAVAIAVTWHDVAWLWWTSVLTLLLCTYLIGLSAWLLFRPRLAYRDGQLLVYLRMGGPIAVPIEVVECFFLGQGPALLPPTVDVAGRAETATVVVRLAEAAQSWKQREVRPALGQWCEGYITIRGTWCEPINGALVKKLNERLVSAHREVRQCGKEAAS